jgi:hypothetical protein
MNSGVEIVLSRMETHPEEFYGECDKWKFIYKEYFRDAMTEAEKGMIFDRIKEIRKEEFTLRVMETMTADQEQDITEEEASWRRAGGFGGAPIKREGSKVSY